MLNLQKRFSYWIAASGNTIFTVEVLKIAKQKEH